jgi:hypothetical protein
MFDVGAPSNPAKFSKSLKSIKNYIPLHAHTGALVRHMKRFSLDADYYGLYWGWQALKNQIEQDKP